jgi:hypothetical protein
VPIDCPDLLRRGILSETGCLSDSEKDLLVGLVSENLHDGEAASAAVAIRRKWLLLSDDRRARVVMKERGYADLLLTTPEAVRCWSQAMQIEGDALRRVLHRVERCAHFRVPRDYPLSEWWHLAVSGSRRAVPGA